MSEIRERLSIISDPITKEIIFSEIYDSDLLYLGPATEHGQDLILEIYDTPWNVLATFRRGYLGKLIKDRYFVENHRGFDHHSREGILVFSGVDFASDNNGEKHHVMDIPATSLQLYGVLIPDDYDGKVEAMFTNNFIDPNPIRLQSGDNYNRYNL